MHVEGHIDHTITEGTHAGAIVGLADVTATHGVRVEDRSAAVPDTVRRTPSTRRR